MRRLVLPVLASVLASVLATACVGAGDPVTAIGHSVYTSSVERLVLDDLGGGFALPPPPDAACDPQIASYDLTVADHQLTWSYCEVAGTGQDATYTPRSGARALTAGEWSALQSTLGALVVVDDSNCGADKGQLALTVTSAGGTVAYGDGFYGCMIHDRPLIDSDALSNAEYGLGQLARTSAVR
jgi:hypothetical protein